VPKDSSLNPGTVGTLNLRIGAVTPFATGLGSPAGVLFVPGPTSGAPQVSVVPAGGVATGGGSTSRTPVSLLTTGSALLLVAGAVAVTGRRRLRRR